MESFDIQININLNASTEEEAEEYITKYLSNLVQGAAISRVVNSWDFIEYIESNCEDSSSL